MRAAATARNRRKKLTGAGQGSSSRDLLDAFRRYYDKVERDSVGNLVVTCTRCRLVQVIAWPDDLAYVRGCLNFAHQQHNHRG